MDYYTQPLPHTLLSAGAERRRNPRKRLQRRVAIGLGKGEIIQGQTVEISSGGVGVMLPKALRMGETCIVRFNMLVDGLAVQIDGVGKVANCSCSGLDGFRVGLQLSVRDAHAANVIEEYVQQY